MIDWRTRLSLQRNYQYYLMLALPLLYYLLFKLLPLGGSIIAFRRYVPSGSIFGITWSGLKYFEVFLTNSTFWRAFRNNLILSFAGLLLGFPIPILFALLLNELRRPGFARFTQTVSYLPRFLSIVVIAGLIKEILSPSSAIFSRVMELFGVYEDVYLINNPRAFRAIYLISDVWQWTGWSAIIYLAALANIDQQMYEAASIDGASRLQQVVHVTIPGMLPAITITLILRIGRMLEIGFEKILLLSSPLTLETADVVSTFVYRVGFQEGNYSYATAVGLTESVLALVMIVSANWVSRRVNETSLW